MVTIARPAVAPVRTLPGRYYSDPAIFAAEQDRIFEGSWLCVGRADRLTTPGSYCLATVGAENVIVLRDRANVLRAFYNVCRHRGARLCTAESGQLKGTVQCRYHAWTYGLDGHLAGAPNMRDVPGFDPDAFGLLPVALQVWEGLIWLNPRDEPTPLAEQLGEHYDRFARYHMGELAVGHTITYDVRANWKLLVENFSECCHCPVMHPELSAAVPSFKAGEVSGYGGGGATFGEGIESLTLTGKTNRPSFPDLTPDDLHTYFGRTLWPNVFLSLHPDYVLIHILQPLAADRTHVICDWLFEPRTIARPDFDPSDAVGMWDLVNRQDWEACEMTQQGMASRAYRNGGIYAPQEAHIRAFNEYVLTMLGHEQPVV